VLEAETAPEAKEKLLVIIDQATKLPLPDQSKRFPVALPSLLPGTGAILHWPEEGFMVIPHHAERTWHVPEKVWNDPGIGIRPLDQPGSSDDLGVLWDENNIPDL